MYWLNVQKADNLAVCNATRHNRFDAITIDAPTYFENGRLRQVFTRLLFHHFNDVSKVLMPLISQFSVDEATIKYYGCKQLMKNKSNKFGYKVWSLSSLEVYLYHCEP
jgi:hypothetical protein